MWTRDKILNSAAGRAGLTDFSDDPSPGWTRTIGALEGEGLIELHTKTVLIPASHFAGYTEEMKAHMKAFGMSTEEHEVTIKTWHLTAAGRAAWLTGGR